MPLSALLAVTMFTQTTTADLTSALRPALWLARIPVRTARFLPLTVCLFFVCVLAPLGVDGERCGDASGRRAEGRPGPLPPEPPCWKNCKPEWVSKVPQSDGYAKNSLRVRQRPLYVSLFVTSAFLQNTVDLGNAIIRVRTILTIWFQQKRRITVNYIRIRPAKIP